MSDPRYFYEQFADEFDSRVNVYDLQKRISIVFGRLLKPDEVVGRTLLDVGCGTGWFSASAYKWGARVTSLDLGERLLAKVAQKCDSDRIVGSILELPFRDRTFDIVFAVKLSNIQLTRYGLSRNCSVSCGQGEYWH